MGGDEDALAGEADRGFRHGREEEVKKLTAFDKLWVQRGGREEEHKPAPLQSSHLFLTVILGGELSHLPLKIQQLRGGRSKFTWQLQKQRSKMHVLLEVLDLFSMPWLPWKSFKELVRVSMSREE